MKLRTGGLTLTFYILHVYRHAFEMPNTVYKRYAAKPNKNDGTQLSNLSSHKGNHTYADVLKHDMVQTNGLCVVVDTISQKKSNLIVFIWSECIYIHMICIYVDARFMECWVTSRNHTLPSMPWQLSVQPCIHFGYHQRPLSRNAS